MNTHLYAITRHIRGVPSHIVRVKAKDVFSDDAIKKRRENDRLITADVVFGIFEGLSRFAR